MQIEIKRNDWLYNAGLTGFLRILRKADKLKKVKLNYDSIAFDLNLLRGFEKDFFAYARTRVTSIDRRLEYCKKFPYVVKKATSKEVLELTHTTKEEAFKTSRSNAYKILGGYKNLTKHAPELVKAITAAPEVESLQQAVAAIARYLTEHEKEFSTEDARLFLLMDFFGGIACFNATFKGDPLKKFKEAFLDDIFKPQPQGKAQYTCTTCGATTETKIFMDAGLLKPFSVSRFKSKNFFWNNTPDAYLCPICRLIYLCVFAGLNPYHKRGEYGHFMFTDSDLAIKENLENNDTFLSLVTEKGLIGNFRDVSVDLNIKKGKELEAGFFFAEISVEKTKALKIDFKTPANMGNLFCKQNDALFDRLRSFKYKDGSMERYVLEETVEALLNNASLEYLITKLLRDALNAKNNRQKDLYSLIKLENIRRTSELEQREKDKQAIKALFKQGEIFGGRILERNYSLTSVKAKLFKMFSPLTSKDNAAALQQLTAFYATFNHKKLTLEEKNLFEVKDNLFILAYLNGLLSAVNKKRIEESTMEEENVA